MSRPLPGRDLRTDVPTWPRAVLAPRGRRLRRSRRLDPPSSTGDGGDRPDLDPSRSGSGALRCPVDRSIEVRKIKDVVAAEVLACLGKWSIRDDAVATLGHMD